MRTSTKLLVVLSLAGSAFAAASIGCSDSGTSSSEGGSTSASSSSSKASSSASTTSTASGTSSSTSTGSGSTSASSSTGGGNMGEHLLISELSVTPDAAEFVEIWNPTNAAVALDDYYLSDNSTYVDLASGQPWMPITNNPGTDFLARFPAGSSIPADGVIVIGFDANYEMQFNACPDFFMGTAPLSCGGNMVPAMLMTEPGSITDSSGLSNPREMVILFTWDGNTADTLKDVDYLAWGAATDPGTRVDKTNVAGYQPDTAPANQKPAAAPVAGQSIERCTIDGGETLTGGNGITGHDETSEDMASSFVVQASPTPGVKNACL